MSLAKQQNCAQIRVSHRGHPRRIPSPGRQTDRENGVIESSHMRRRCRRDSSPARMNDDVVRVDAGFLQHGAQKCRFVLTITKAMVEHFCRRMRLYTADSKFDGNVANVLLHEFRECAHLDDWRGS